MSLCRVSMSASLVLVVCFCFVDYWSNVSSNGHDAHMTGVIALNSPVLHKSSSVV